MVAGNEHALDMPPVRSLAAGEHLPPCRRDGLQFRHEAGVGNVAGEHDGVDLLVAEPFKRTDERAAVVALQQALSVGSDPNVDVAHDAERHVRLSRRRIRRRQAKYRQRAKRRRTADKASPRQHHVSE